MKVKKEREKKVRSMVKKECVMCSGERKWEVGTYIAERKWEVGTYIGERKWEVGYVSYV